MADLALRRQCHFKTSSGFGGGEGRSWPHPEISSCSYTSSTPGSQRRRRKTLLLTGNRCANRDSSAQLLGQFIEQPVQIFIVLARFVDLLNRVQEGGVLLAAVLSSDLRKGGLGKV